MAVASAYVLTTNSSAYGAPRKYLSFFANVTCTPGLNSLKPHGPIEAGGFMLSGLSSIFVLVSVVLLFQTVLNCLLGRMPPAPAPPIAAVAGQNTFANLISMTLPLSLIVTPARESVFP